MRNERTEIKIEIIPIGGDLHAIQQGQGLFNHLNCINDSSNHWCSIGDFRQIGGQHALRTSSGFIRVMDVVAVIRDDRSFKLGSNN